MTIAVAMSGGVDSSVAAALLAGQGHEVIGVSMQLYARHPDGRAGEPPFGTCCTLDDLRDAQRVAHALGIPHYILNFEESFHEAVIADFVREYASGRTPIPCAHCNGDLKFARLLDRADAFGADALATGHYARIDRDGDGAYRLRRGADAGKDQSYFLFAMTQDQLARARFPVGDLRKDDVRAHADRLGLAVARKPDSQEICFVPDGDYAAFVERARPGVAREGAIVDRGGQRLGTHGGIHRFTVGQRKGLGISSSQPLYVLAIRPDDAEVVVGPREALHRQALTASRVNWVSGRAPAAWRTITAQVRYRHRAARARVRAIDSARAEVVFDAPQPAITPGQAVVFYEGDVVIGGGWID